MKIQEPLILKEGKYTLKDLTALKSKYKIWKTNDIYESQLNELFEITFPNLIKSLDFETKKSQYKKTKLQNQNLKGDWIYFLWSGELIHSVKETDYFNLRTNRNKNLINKNEQQKLYKSCVGFLGLSVGSNAATTLAYQGIAQNLKLAEFDTLETTNLNRVRSGLHNLFTPKLDIASKQIYEIDPYAKIHPFPKGLTKKLITNFLNQKPTPHVVFEIIDDFEIKILLRIEAKKRGIPVIMTANLGDSILIDVERYDIDKDLIMFNGLLGSLPEDILSKPDEDRNKYAVQIVGRENVPQKAMESVIEIGKTLVGRPQLSSTVTAAGGIAAYLTRMIILDKQLKSGRYKFSLDNLFNITNND